MTKKVDKWVIVIANNLSHEYANYWTEGHMFDTEAEAIEACGNTVRLESDFLIDVVKLQFTIK